MDAGDGVRDKPALTDRAGMEFRAVSEERAREGESEKPRRGLERPAVTHPDQTASAPQAGEYVFNVQCAQVAKALK